MYTLWELRSVLGFYGSLVERKLVVASPQLPTIIDDVMASRGYSRAI